ncbi:MAG TPA: hypothetical protein VM662_00030, partial [Sphingomonas sp.]|nr:hypothetical protein [Sphingomonas sp.]
TNAPIIPPPLRGDSAVDGSRTRAQLSHPALRGESGIHLKDWGTYPNIEARVGSHPRRFA